MYAESVYIFQSLSSLASSLKMSDSSILSIYIGFIKVYAESVYIFQSLSSLASSLEMADSSILSIYIGFIKVYAESVYIFQSLSSLASSLEMADSSILSAFNISGRLAHPLPKLKCLTSWVNLCYTNSFHDSLT